MARLDDDRAYLREQGDNDFLKRRAQPGETLQDLDTRRAVEDHNAAIDSARARQAQEAEMRRRESAARAEESKRRSAIRQNESLTRGRVAETEKTLEDYEKTRPEAVSKRDTVGYDWKSDEKTAGKRRWFGLGGPTKAAEEAQQRLGTYKERWNEAQREIDELDRTAKAAEREREQVRALHERDKALADQLDDIEYRENAERLGLSADPAPLTQQPFTNLQIPGGTSQGTGGGVSRPTSPTQPTPAPASPSSPASVQPAGSAAPTQPAQQPAAPEASLPLETREWTPEHRKTWAGLNREQKQAFVARKQGEAQERVDVRRRGAESLAEADEEFSWARVVGDSIKGTLAPVLKGISTLGSGALGTVAAVQRAAGGDPTYGAQSMARAIEDYWTEAIPEELRDTVGTKLGEGMGSAMAFLPGGALGAGTKGGAFAVSAVTGAVMNGGNAYLEGKDMGMTEREALTRFAAGAGLGTTEALGVGRVFDRLNKFTGGGMSRFLLELGKQGIEEGAQETFQSAMTDFVDRLILPEGDPRAKALDRIWKDAAESGAYGAAIGLLFGGMVGGAQRSAYRQEIARNDQAIAEAEEQMGADEGPARYQEIADLINTTEAESGGSGALPAVGPDVVDLAVRLQRGGALDETGAAVAESRNRLESLWGEGESFGRPLDLEAVAGAQREYLQNLNTLSASRAADSEAIAAPEFQRALTIAREVWRFSDEMPVNERTGQPQNVSQRRIAETIARIAMGGEPTAADMALRGADGKPIFKQQDGRVALVNPITRQALEAEAPTLASTWNTYEQTRPVSQDVRPQGRPAQEGEEGAAAERQADAGRAVQRDDGPGERPAATGGVGRYRLDLRGGEGTVVRSVEFEAQTLADARQMVEDGAVPGLALQPGERFDVRTDLQELAGPVQDVGESAASPTERNSGDERFAPRPWTALATEMADAVRAPAAARAFIEQAAETIQPAFDRWRALFPTVKFAFRSGERRTGGFSYDPESKALTVNVEDVLRETSNQQAAALDRRILEEWAHMVTTDLEAQGKLDAQGLFNALPESLKAHIRAVYPEAKGDYQQRHEFLRMVLQDRIEITPDGKLVWRDEGGQETTESISASLRAKLGEAIDAILAYIRDLKARLVQDGAGSDVVEMLDEALRVIRENMGPLLNQEVKRENDNLQFTIPDPVRSAAIAFGESIPESELYLGEQGTDSYGTSGYGREDDPHVTLLYGPNKTTAQIRMAVEGVGPVPLRMGKVSIFSNDDSPYDVVKVDVTGAKLQALHAKLKKQLGTASTFEGYKPHVTIAYVKKGEGAKYVGDTRFEGQEVLLDSFIHSGADQSRTEVRLNEQAQPQQEPAASAAAAPAPQPERAPAGPQREQSAATPASGGEVADTVPGSLTIGGETVPTAGQWAAKNPRGPEVVTGTVALVPLRLLGINTQLSETQDRQNREQTGAAQRAEIVRNMTQANIPLAWDAGNSLTEGSPIIDPTGSVLVGNNRAMALRDIHGDPNQARRAAFYQRWVRARAAELGIDAFAGEPVALVRVSADLGGLQTTDFVRAANRSGTQQKTVAEHALAEADAAVAMAGVAPGDELGEFYRRTGQAEDMRDSAGRPDDAKIRARLVNARVAALLRPAPEGAQTATRLIDQQAERWARGPLWGSLLQLADAAIDLRDKGEAGVADALGGFAQRLVQNQIAEQNFERALRRTAEQTEADLDPGSDTATAQALADAFRDEIAMVTTARGNAKFDADLTLEGIAALMAGVRRAITDYRPGDGGLFGEVENVREKIRTALDRHRTLKDAMLASQAGDEQTPPVPEASRAAQPAPQAQGSPGGPLVNPQDQAKWESALEAHLANPDRRAPAIVLGETPRVLRNLGLLNLDLVMRPADVMKVMGQVRDGHSINAAQLKMLPAQIASPRMIFRSPPTATAQGLIVLTSLWETGQPVVAIIHPNKLELHRHVNRIASLYGRNRWKETLQEWMNAGLLLYADEKKGKDWSRIIGLQLPEIATNPQSQPNISVTPVNRDNRENSSPESRAPEGGALMSQASDLHLANVALRQDAEGGGGESRFAAAARSDAGRGNLHRQFRRLFDRQRAGETLTPGQRAALDEMEQALGQRLLLDVEAFAPMRQLPLLSQAADRNLVAVHNLSQANLRHVLKMGGLAVPSMAIVRSDRSTFDNFGDVTLIADKSLIDPKQNRASRVFNADVYSPRYPSVHVEMLPESKKALATFLKGTDAVAGPGYSDTINGILESIKSDGLQHALENSARVMVKYLQERGTPVEIDPSQDDWTIKSRLRAAVRHDETGEAFAKWVSELPEREGWQTKERIFDGFNYSGNRKYLPHNLDTVVRILKRKLQDGEGFNYGVPSVRATVAKRFRTVEQIQKAREDIIPSEQMQALKDDVDAEFLKLAEEARPHRANSGNDFGFLDRFSDDMKAMAEGGTENFRHLREMYPGGEPFQAMREFLEKLRNMPTEYFEGKVQRAVQLQEFAAAVVPSDMPADLRGQIERRGLDVIEYPKGDKEARREAVERAGQQVNALFSQPGAPLDFGDADTLRRLDDLETRALREVTGDRTIGNPELAFAADNATWMSVDQLRKEQFQVQKEREWEDAARRMLAADYVGVRDGILQKGFAAQQLDPVLTKAAQMIVARESALPRTDERRRLLQRLVYAYRETGTASARAMRARKDPHHTKAERYREFFARRIYDVPPHVRKLLEGAPSRRELDSRIRRLEERLEAAKRQNNANESRLVEKELELARKTETKEALLDADADGRVSKLLAKLEKMGVTVDDILGGQIELRLMGAKIIQDVAAGYSEKERATLRLLQRSVGQLPMRKVAERVGLTLEQVTAINDRFMAQMKRELADRFQRGVEIEELELVGTDTALRSQAAERAARSREEAERMADQALRMMGFFASRERDKIKVRRARVRVQPVPTGPDAGYGGGRFAEGQTIPPRTGVLPLEGPPTSRQNTEFETGVDRLFPTRTPEPGFGANPEFETGVNGRLFPTPQGTNLAPNPEFATGNAGRLFPSSDQTNLGPNSEFTGTLEPEYRDMLVAAKLDPENDVDMLHLHRAMSVAEGGRWVDYANEIIFNNLLSAPLTGITNLTGYAYAAYELGIRRGIEAAINRIGKRDANAAQFGELRPMLRALGRGFSRALANGVASWSTESPIFAQDVLGGQVEFDANLLERSHGPRIPGRFGRTVRIPTRLLMAVDEGMKTLIGQAQAAAIAYRLGRQRGLTKQALENFIDAQISGQGTPAWQIAHDYALRIAYQKPLRTWKQMNEEGEVNVFNRLAETTLKHIQDLKNADTSGDGLTRVGAETGQILLNLIFPFIRTPFRLLQLGLENTLPGAVMGELQARDRTVKVGDKRVRVIRGEDAKVAARATSLTAALATVLLMAAGEGDEDDDDKPLLVTGSRPRGSEDDRVGLRELGYRTTPQYTVRIGGRDGIQFSYERIDPFATAIATSVDMLRGIKETERGRPWSEAGWNVVNSIYNQLLEKANLRGLSELNDLATGRQGVGEYAIDTATSATIPNIIRNPLRNADPYIRDTRSMPLGLEKLAYKAFPAEALAPPPKVDIYGRPVEKRGTAATRTFVPGQPGTQPAARERLDEFLGRYNTLHPTEKWAPAVPSNRLDSETGERQMTPEQYNRFLTVRGNLFKRYAEETGVLDRRAPNKDDVAAIKNAASKATREAKKRLGL